MSDAVGFVQIADRCGVTPGAVRQWKRRYDDFPREAGFHGSANGGKGALPWWWWRDVALWLDDHPNLGRTR